MEFITQDLKTTLGLTDDQVKGLSPSYENHIAEIKKGWDGKANTDAEGIINGALSKIVEVTKVSRNTGEKAGDYITRASESHLGNLKTDLENAKSDYATKLKEFKGDEATKQELDKAKQELDDAKKILADYDSIKEKAEKFEPLQADYLNMKKSVAFRSVKPNFPTEVNQYEAKAKWDSFTKDVEDKFTIELVDNEPIAIDKTNEHKRVKLSELVSQSKELTELMQGRTQQGTGATPTQKTLEGVPFKVPENVNGTDLSKLINEHLDTKMTMTDPNRAKAFSELWAKIKNAK